MLRIAVFAFAFYGVGWALAETPAKQPTDTKKNLPPDTTTSGATSDVDLVERCINARKEYENSLKALFDYYQRVGDKLRMQWIEQELMGYHLLNKPSYNLDVKDVPPPSLEAKVNVREANELYRSAMEYKGRGLGNDYILNQRRTELLLREILEKYPSSDKISDVAYQLAELYESKAYKQYDRAARFYERSFQWKKGTATDARMRAATLYDKQLNERGKALELYRDEIAHDTDTDRIKTAEKRLAELTGLKK
jgi:hypothetical protein